MSQPTATAEPPAPGFWMAWALPALLVAVGVAMAWQLERRIAAHQQARFEMEARRVESAILERMTAYVQVLRGGLGLYAASDEVTREDWRLYVETLKLSARYPGIRSMSFAAAVPTAELDAFIARVRAEPLPPGLADPVVLREYRLRAPPPPITPVATTLHAPVLYTEPLVGHNMRSLGVDMMVDAARQATLLDAQASGEARLSTRLRLVRTEGTQVGFIAFLPVQRKGQPLGWLTAVFYAEDFMRGLFGGDDGPLDFALHDGAPGEASLLYSTAGVSGDGNPLPLPEGEAVFLREQVLELPGRQWTIRLIAREGFVPLADRLAPALLLLGALLAALLLASSTRAAARWRAQAAALRQAEAEVRHQATHDPLTGLANRKLFLDRLDGAIRRAERHGGHFSVAYIDIDGFKAVNDGLGHQAGDALLQAIAARLISNLRREDTLARLGGDEFAVVLERAGNPETVARDVGEALIVLLREPFAIAQPTGTAEARVGASIGAAVYPRHGRDCDGLIGAADAAMYIAKRGGKNRCVLAAPVA